MEKISIIIPIFNVENYIADCIESVISQTYQNIEIILIDDGSTDNSGLVCDKYKNIDNRVKVYHKKNGGVSSSRNYGLKKATGNYIFFMDSDDLLKKDTIELLYYNIKTYKSDMACCGFSRVDYYTCKKYSDEMNQFKNNFLDINDETIGSCAYMSSCVWGKLMRKTILNDIFFPNEKMISEDMIFNLKILPNIKRISFTNSIGYIYRVHSSSLTFNINEELTNNLMKELKNIKKDYIEKKYSKGYLEYLDLMCFIHIGIALPHRYDESKKRNVNKYIKKIKNYMNNNFYGWNNIKITQNGKITIKSFCMWCLKKMYQFNIFIVFIKIYNFMINKLKINVKW